MKLHIEHDTCYGYEGEVRASIQYLRLTPKNNEQQKILDWHLELPGDANEIDDGYGNRLTVLTLDYPQPEITIRAVGTVDLKGIDICTHDSCVPPQVFLRQTELTEPDNELRRFAEQYPPNYDGLQAMMRDLLSTVRYTPGATTVSHTAAEAFAIGAGVCQDHTHIFVACCRHLGMPARYVSGYIHTQDGDHISSHAWAEVWIDDGWYTFDVANGLLMPDSHLKLAVGLDYLEAAPVRGIRYGGGQESLSASALVSRMANEQ
ncbi:transglutaminase family protein [Mangrovitalea sediminis]|uniref:transglutaminase family protein n=1 Tax=Mangrovitalea sediminis TaxID=1982043 RepID=UPI000BE5CBFA|nr:transglutaminase family protein [Mangrovitalea sediminis]